jgi:hypothetical protein
MGMIKRLKRCIDKIDYHHTENGVPLNSAIQTVADESRFSFKELQAEYQQDTQ